jgi:peptidoglycan/xylan/chitin deacetylase (PgdA/CDA1 family)
VKRSVERLVSVAWRIPAARRLVSRRPVILLYHGVPASATAAHSGAVFEQHVRFMKQHFEFVSPDDLESKRAPGERLRILLTFDDGYRNNAEVVAPILRLHGVPALFFVSSRHAAPGKYLWFSYLWALEASFPRNGFAFRGAFFDMRPAERRRSVHRLSRLLLSLRPHPSAMYEAIEGELPRLEEFVSDAELTDRYAGMTAEQVAQLAADPLFSIGAHTVDHPFLTKCDPAEARRQVEANRRWLEAVSGRRCDAIAYPSGDYDTGTLELCRQAAFTRGYAVTTRIDRASPLELSRIGIYSDSTDALAFKVQWGGVLRELRVPIG